MTRQGAACENGVNKIGKARLNFIQTNWQRVHILRLDFIQSPFLVQIPHILVQCPTRSPHCEEVGWKQTDKPFLPSRCLEQDNFWSEIILGCNYLRTARVPSLFPPLPNLDREISSTKYLTNPPFAQGTPPLHREKCYLYVDLTPVERDT